MPATGRDKSKCLKAEIAKLKAENAALRRELNKGRIKHYSLQELSLSLAERSFLLKNSLN